LPLLSNCVKVKKKQNLLKWSIGVIPPFIVVKKKLAIISLLA